MKRCEEGQNQGQNLYLAPRRKGAKETAVYAMAILIKVDCYAGYRGEQEPRTLEMGGNTVAVQSILDRWFSPDHRYFKITDKDACIYIIRHDVIAQFWELVYYLHPDVPGKG